MTLQLSNKRSLFYYVNHLISRIFALRDNKHKSDIKGRKYTGCANLFHIIFLFIKSWADQNVRGVNTKGKRGGGQQISQPKFPKNCIKLKKNWAGGRPKCVYVIGGSRGRQGCVQMMTVFRSGSCFGFQGTLEVTGTLFLLCANSIVMHPFIFCNAPVFS